MQNQFKKKKNFSIFYIILAIADFSYTIFNLVRHFLYDDFAVFELFSSLGRKILYLLPLFAFIILSKKTAEIEDSQKLIKIKKYVKLYLIVCFVSGIVHFVLTNLFSCSIPIFPFCLFYTFSWAGLLSMIIKYHIYYLIFSLILDVCFWVISIVFIKSLGKKINPEVEFKEGIGKTSAGYNLGIASIILLSIQTVLNIGIAGIMHDNLSGVSGEQAIGAAVFAFILILLKLFLDLILLPVIPLSIASIVKCNSKKEIEQDRKNRLPGKKINIICLVIAVAELVLIW